MMNHLCNIPSLTPGPDFVKTALVPFKYPRTVEYLDELPKTGTGKIDRQRLRGMNKGLT